MIMPDTKYEDVGVITVGPFKFPNWYFIQYGKKDGMVDVVTALKRSNDIFFYKVGEGLGIDKLASWSRKLGMGKALGLDISGEAKGLVPDENWKKKNRGEGWYLGDTYHLAIGQGDLLATPLQVNFWTNVVASDGYLCKPTVLNLEPRTKNQEQLNLEPRIKNLEPKCVDLGLKKEDIDLVKKGMIQACSPASSEEGVGGTGWPLFNFKIENVKWKIDNVDFLETAEATISGKPIVEVKTACKTGTAEYGDPKGKTHAWFTDFAPAENPQLTVTVLYEGGGEGSSDAGPIAKEILKTWFEK
ncbi:MAG: Penicillin-binding protein 2 [Candidatus Gottesmanbacteria bacterium GW2011_GWC2_39_8]|uniref:Penicillin-binding protein 2 n=1 Tax=Candidatus Gottesmanbacteria bacterium GW2011_GWC2_39_8 TaxID=1618450 RepID=A0A0G0Q9J7_9BACT|nr:MAG: Penicillin-binding protein 2 [Candidatus Gottesmanbacteria bacterium GW2011_GWC2_39_8]